MSMFTSEDLILHSVILENICEVCNLVIHIIMMNRIQSTDKLVSGLLAFISMAQDDDDKQNSLKYCKPINIDQLLHYNYGH